MTVKAYPFKYELAVMEKQKINQICRTGVFEHLNVFLSCT